MFGPVGSHYEVNKDICRYVFTKTGGIPVWGLESRYNSPIKTKRFVRTSSLPCIS